MSALIFTGPTGAPIRRGNFNKLVAWQQAAAGLGLPGLHFHDLRHTGNTFAAKSGVGTKDLMGRMGHDSMQAALIYQRATDTGDDRIKAALEAEIAALGEYRTDR
jgi:integrase